MMVFGSIAVALLFIVGVVALVIWGARRAGNRSEQDSSGGDLVAYLILAIAVTVGGFGLAELFATAFPGDQLIFDPTSDLATSLSAIVVAAPFLIYFWRRQAIRRPSFPGSVGWTLYLAYVELVFGVAAVISAVAVINGLFTDSSASGWNRMVVYLAILVGHEVASRRTPPRSDGAELPVVVGSAIAVVTLASGSIGLLGDGILTEAYAALAGDPVANYEPWMAMTIVGAVYWWYRWWRPRLTDDGLPLQIYIVLTTSFALIAAMVGASAIVSLSLSYLLTDTPPAGDHFSTVPIWLAGVMVGLALWVVHRRELAERNHSLRAYEYLLASVGLAFTVGLATALTIFAFQEDQLVGGDAGDVVVAATLLVIAAGVWLWFSTRFQTGDTGVEEEAWPRRVYLLGMSVILGLTAAGSLVSTLFILIRRLLDGGPTSDLVVPVSITLYAGTATGYLLSHYLSERAGRESPEVISPFTVTIISSHPGSISTRLPKQAQVRVIHRADGAGVITDKVADEIVNAVGATSSVVWVDDDGFKVAPTNR